MAPLEDRAVERFDVKFGLDPRRLRLGHIYSRPVGLNVVTRGMIKATSPSWVHLYDFKFRFWPILLAGLLMEAILRSARAAAKWIYLNGPAAWEDHVSIFLLLAIAFQAMLGLLGILAMRRLLPEADAHLRWPPNLSYVGLAFLLGIGMGLIMLAADYWPQLQTQTPPNTSYSQTTFDAVGFLVGMLTTGLAEETIFRGLLVGFLVVLMPGRLRIGPIDLPVAGYIVALLFGLAHWHTFLMEPFHQAVAQQLYAFLWGLTYVWLMERSKSLLAPVVAHGLGNFTEVGLIILLVALWS